MVHTQTHRENQLKTTTKQALDVGENIHMVSRQNGVAGGEQLCVRVFLLIIALFFVVAVQRFKDKCTYVTLFIVFCVLHFSPSVSLANLLLLLYKGLRLNVQLWHLQFCVLCFSPVSSSILFLLTDQHRLPTTNRCQSTHAHLQSWTFQHCTTKVSNSCVSSGCVWKL